MKFIVKRHTRKLLPFKGAKAKDERLVSVTLSVDLNGAYRERSMLAKIADALERDFSRVNIKATGSVVSSKDW